MRNTRGDLSVCHNWLTPSRGGAMNGQKSAEKLRLILWRQWKKPRTRAKKLIQLGIERVRALTSAYTAGVLGGTPGRRI